MLCLIYVFYFVAKSLVLTNKRKDVTVGDYVWSLVLLWASLNGLLRQLDFRSGQMYENRTYQAL
jgi:hypothetical protein